MSSSTVPDSAASDYPRSWDWVSDGELVGRYVETRSVKISDGSEQALVDLKLETGEVVSVWLTPTVLRNRFADELRKRLAGGNDDFFPGEQMTIARGASKKPSATGDGYWPFTVEFEHAAKQTAASILLDDEQAEEPTDDGVPF